MSLKKICEIKQSIGILSGAYEYRRTNQFEKVLCPEKNGNIKDSNRRRLPN